MVLYSVSGTLGSPNAMTTITYDFVRPSYMTDAMDYLTGVFTARVSGDYQFNFQGRNVKQNNLILFFS